VRSLIIESSGTKNGDSDVRKILHDSILRDIVKMKGLEPAFLLMPDAV
jgi:hypothetical protein